MMDHEDRESTARELQRKITDWVQLTRDEILPAVAKMYQGGYWRELGFDSWERYLSDGIGPILDTLRTKSAFPGVVGELTAAGLSTRGIGAVTGTSKDTVARQQQQVSHPETPASTTVKGTDGKVYSRPSRKPATEAEMRVVLAAMHAARHLPEIGRISLKKGTGLSYDRLGAALRALLDGKQIVESRATHGGAVQGYKRLIPAPETSQDQPAASELALMTEVRLRRMLCHVLGDTGEALQISVELFIRDCLTSIMRWDATIIEDWPAAIARCLPSEPCEVRVNGVPFGTLTFTPSTPPPSFESAIEA